MKITVLNGSPKGDQSVTMQYMNYIEKKFPGHKFTRFNITSTIKKIERDEKAFDEIIDSVRKSDGVIWAFPLYFLVVHAGYKRFVELISLKGAESAFKGYKGYPASICTSVNEEVVHGIPGRRELASGDILSLDVGVRLRRYHGDAAATFPIGEVSDGAMRLIAAAEGALAAAVASLEPDVPLVEVSRAIQSHAEERGYQVVRRFVGHGIGRRMHEDPQVPNYVAPGTPPGGVRLRAGTVLAIEPMLNEGTGEVEELADGWTVVTADRSLSAHAEHTVAVTEHGAEILTALG